MGFSSVSLPGGLELHLALERSLGQGGLPLPKKPPVLERALQPCMDFSAGCASSVAVCLALARTDVDSSICLGWPSAVYLIERTAPCT